MSKKGMFTGLAAAMLMAMPAFAQETAGAAATGGVKWGALAAAFTMGIAAFAGAFGQGKATAAACEGIARNPGAGGAIRLMAILGLAFIESLVIYALVIAFLIKGA
ncbi:MAG: ATP synthase F0 subunit C [Thermoanaerobaculia bacterium]